VAAPFAQSQASASVGDIDQYLTLNGTTQYAAATDSTNSALDIQGSITLEAWLMPTSSCSGDQFIINKYVAYSLYCGSSGLWKYAFSSDGTTWSGVATGVKIIPNVWQHVALTHASGTTTARLYVNGQFLETETVNIPATIAANNNNFFIGTYSSSNFFQGSIDDVRLYNSQRTDAQIRTDMNTYGPNTDSNLIAYYDFNDESGSSVANADASPAANTTLTLYGSPTYSNVESTTVINGDQVITFPRSYLTANGGWRIPSYTSTVKSLVVGGGGAGGSRAGAGGGAGGYVYDAALSVTPNSVQSITVGMGGRGFLSAKGNNGTNSQLGSLRTALGGGAGGTDNGPLADFFGNAGGSGGGSDGDYTASPYTSNGGASTQSSTLGYGVGFAGGGGYASGNWPGGGGGGANGLGGTGTSTSTGGNGGAGITDPIGGTTICYATGGGGGGGTSPGIGGNCGSGITVNNNAGGPLNTTTWPGVATANTGSGGGGGSWNGSSDPIGGFGASGVVILRYALNMSVSLSYSGGTTAIYRTVGTITATSSLAGKVTFYDHGKAIPGCKNVATNGSNVATCSWKPSLHGNATITATGKPSNTYVPNGSTLLNIGVAARSGKR